MNTLKNRARPSKSLKKIIAIFCTLFCFPAIANDCLAYKLNPRVFIDTPDWQRRVVQPLAPMDLWHGNVVATLVDNYDIIADITATDDGFCVALKTVNATVGYSDFLVKIDMRHAPESCSYNAVLSHEDSHIRTYLSVMDDFKAELQKSVFAAADSVMPIFVRDKSDMDAAINMMNNELQSHPDLILIKQKIHAAQEIRNKRLDMNDDGAELRKCI